MSNDWLGKLEKIDDYRWQIPQSYKPGMRVPGMIYADEKLLKDILKDKSLEQVANVAFFPGIVKYSLAMPDIHWGYGMPVGGVAATDPDDGGVISPGAVGYDINCGVRMMRTNLNYEETFARTGGHGGPPLRELMTALFNNIPCGVGVGGDVKTSYTQLKQVIKKGAAWAVEQGFGSKDDLLHTEANGCLDGADPHAISDRAYKRGKGQLGTLGSGNHFLEVQVVDQIYDSVAAERMGLDIGQVTVMIHSGSRGFGYQVCDDYLVITGKAMQKYGIQMPDRQLACVPIKSAEGQSYIGAMRGAANYAWCNRQILMHLARELFEKFFNSSWEKLGMSLIYDVAHNIAKFEQYEVDGKKKTLCVHRKGATRAFPPGHLEIPEVYRDLGQPVIIPGDMGRNSYLLLGTAKAVEETFGTTCHGAGRVMSRTAAVKASRGRSIARELEDKGIIALGRGRNALEEEQPDAYKDVNEVVNVVHSAGIAKRIARMRPIGVIKG